MSAFLDKRIPCTAHLSGSALDVLQPGRDLDVGFGLGQLQGQIEHFVERGVHGLLVMRRKRAAVRGSGFGLYDLGLFGTSNSRSTAKRAFGQQHGDDQFQRIGLAGLGCSNGSVGFRIEKHRQYLVLVDRPNEHDAAIFARPEKEGRDHAASSTVFEK